MTTFALFLVLAAACCHATWNYLVKRLNAGPELVWLFSVIASVLFLPVAVGVAVLQRPVFGGRELTFCLVSAALHMAYFLLLQQGYRKGDLSLVYPTARATGPFLSTAFAVIFLGEVLTLPVLAGGLAVVTGVLFLTGGLRRNRARHLTSSVIFGLAAGTLIGSYTIWDAYTVRTVMVPPLLLEFASILSRAVLLAPYAWRRRETVNRLWRDQRSAVIGIAVFNPLAYVLVLFALVFTPVVYVAPAREVSVLITVAMGSLLLGEGELRKRLFWAALILAGMVLLASA